MDSQARAIWDALTFPTPAMLRVVERLAEEQLSGLPPNGVNSIGWLVWHIAEVEDKWVRENLLHLPRRYPFGASVKAVPRPAVPLKDQLLAYFKDVRALSEERLGATTDGLMDATVDDETYGTITVRQVWAGVATSSAWHGGQIVHLNRLMTG